MEIMERNILDAALGYHDIGWSVVPAMARAKRPSIRWQPFQDRRASKGDLKKWFERRPDANLAVVTGAISGIVVLDVDVSHGGRESLKQLTDIHGPLPDTVESRTGGGGRHLYFRHPGREFRNRTGIEPGIDIRGDGGVIIVPPSIHPSGKPYVWRKGHAPGEISLARLPEWLAEPRFPRRKGHSVAYWRELVRNGVSEGQRNQSLASLSGHLLWHEVDVNVVLELLLAWNAVRCRPPLDDDEVISVVRSIERTQQRAASEDPGA